MSATSWVSWYYRRWRAADAAPRSSLPASVKAQWDFSRFFIIYPAATGYLAKLILDEIAPALEFDADAGALAFLVTWVFAVLYLLACGLISKILGTEWIKAKN